MQFSLLGPVQALSDDATPIDIGGARLRMLLARLVLEAGRPVSAESLIDDLWGEQAPAGAASALQGLVSRLRRALGGAGAVELVAGGYRVLGESDVRRFEELAARGRRDLAAGRPQEAAGALAQALGLWRGPALADIQEAPFAGPVATRLADLRAAALEDSFDAEVRLGRHTEVLPDLNAAAIEHPLSERLAELRMRALAAAGRQSDALTAYAEIRDRLGDELGVDPSPALQEVHLALLRGELERPVAQAQAAPSRLPARLTSFVGRERELGQLAGLLSSSRLVTVVGPGGAGKTRLSLEAASRHPAHERGRVWFVGLAGVGAPGQLGDTVLSALSTLDEGGATGGTHADRIAQLLDVGEAVLVLDNCEHLVEAAAELAEQLLSRRPDLRILATSREPLAIIGEALCHLGPLELPSTPAEAAQSAAVRLFVERAAGVRPDFTLDAATVEPVVEICWRLDGLPLALELAAAKLRAMNVGQIARRLDDRFRLLTSGSRTALPRQRTLLAVVEWSWDLLDDLEQLLARRLSAFPGGATLESLEAVCADEELPADDVLYVAGSLVEKSLVMHDGERYRMLETVRAFCATKRTEDLTARFHDHFLALAEEYEPLLRTGEQLRAISFFETEYDNLIHALRTTPSARFVGAMFWYWGLRGLSSQFESFLEYGHVLPSQVREAFGVVGARAGLDSAGAREFHPARPLMRMAELALSDEHADLEQALRSKDPWVRASAYWEQDFVLAEQGVLRSGLEALRGFEEAGDRWGLVMSLLPVARNHSLKAEYGPALALLERAVMLSTELGTEDYLYLCRARLARERRRSGDLEGALRDIQSAYRQATERGHRRLEVNILVGLANVQRLSGELDLANQTLDRLESLPTELTGDLIVSTRLENRLAEGEAEEARRLLPLAVAPQIEGGYSNGLAWAAELQAGVLALEGRPEEAAESLGMSAAIRGAFDYGEPELTGLLGRLAGFEEAFRRGTEMPRQTAIDRLTVSAGSIV
ncbi:BTAD domain-containing putative transcriptional regulator [Nonomuraea soli]|uniref:Putative ATPase n=1 Tax=Nonomuraea soli TaxID=1032476 RepID=A0A7W0CJ32_9ACTN|nr:BTAD domain-containing putative transcriptional regulator [Nonomuraea soli]MBA2892004.1 putative ATPase [Nonomuraea soli]